MFEIDAHVKYRSVSKINITTKYGESMVVKSEHPKTMKIYEDS